MAVQLLLYLIVHLEVSSRTAATDREPRTLYFSLMVSSAPSFNTSEVVSAVDQTLDFVNNESTILPGRRLQYSGVLDTQVS